MANQLGKNRLKRIVDMMQSRRNVCENGATPPAHVSDHKGGNIAYEHDDWVTLQTSGVL